MHGKKAVVLIGANERARTIFGSGVASGVVDLGWAATGADAVAQIEGRGPDLFVVALGSDEDAVEALRTLRQARPDAKVVILGGGKGTPGGVLDALREHAFAFLAVPWSVSDARGAISQALSIQDWEDGIDVLSARPDWLTLSLRCREVTANRVLAFFDQLPLDLPEEERRNLGAAVQEILLSAISRAAGADPKRRIRISRIRTPRAILYHVEDPEPGSTDASSNPDTVSPPGDSLDAVEKSPGDLGRLTALGLVDEVVYNKASNEVILVRYLQRSEFSRMQAEGEFRHSTSGRLP